MAAIAAVCLVLGSLAASAAPIGGAGADSIRYEADRVEDDRQSGIVTFTGNVRVQYKDVELKAARITFDRKRQLLEAEGMADSTGEGWVGRPVFVRGGEKMEGSWMAYDLKTKRGTVRQGKAVHQRKYLRGEQLMLDPRRDLHARALSLSTCSRDHPHYDFLCGNLKVIENEKAIGRSVTFRIGPVPVFWLPFFVFPMEGERSSGLLTPSIGSNSRDGIFARNIGYYYAPNDYWDATAKGTARERGGFLLETDFRYAIRSRLSGSADFAFEKDTRDPSRTRRNWRLNLRHQQKLSPTMGMRGTGTFTSSSTFDQVNGDDAYSFFNRQLRSSFSGDKQWREAGRSVDASFSYFNDLTTDQNRFQGFPRVSFRQGRRPILGPRKTRSADRTWYQSIFYDFSGKVDNVFTSGAEDDTENLSIQGRLGVNSQQRFLGWLDFTPGASVTQLVSRNDLDQPTRRETYAASISTGTTLYGIFHPRVGRLRAVRHRLQPRLSFRYNQSATVSGGTFGFGGTRTAGDARRSLGMSLNNAFEIKTEVDGKERRSTFATANLSTGFDFDANGSNARNWSPLRTTVSIKPDKRFDLRLNMSHLLEDEAGKFSPARPDLQTLSITSTVRIVGTRRRPDTADGPWDSLRSNTPQEFGFERGLYEQAEDVSQPWRFSLSHFYEIRDTGATNDTRSWLKSDLGFNPTPEWRINYGINLDLVERDLTAQSLSIYRTLHCWEASFSWFPNGFNQGFAFRINIRDLPQIGLSHRDGGFGL